MRNPLSFVLLAIFTFGNALPEIQYWYMIHDFGQKPPNVELDSRLSTLVFDLDGYPIFRTISGQLFKVNGTPFADVKLEGILEFYYCINVDSFTAAQPVRERQKELENDITFCFHNSEALSENCDWIIIFSASYDSEDDRLDGYAKRCKTGVCDDVCKVGICDNVELRSNNDFGDGEMCFHWQIWNIELLGDSNGSYLTYVEGYSNATIKMISESVPKLYWRWEIMPDLLCNITVPISYPTPRLVHYAPIGRTRNSLRSDDTHIDGWSYENFDAHVLQWKQEATYSLMYNYTGWFMEPQRIDNYREKSYEAIWDARNTTLSDDNTAKLIVDCKMPGDVMLQKNLYIGSEVIKTGMTKTWNMAWNQENIKFNEPRFFWNQLFAAVTKPSPTTPMFILQSTTTKKKELKLTTSSQLSSSKTTLRAFTVKETSSSSATLTELSTKSVSNTVKAQSSKKLITESNVSKAQSSKKLITESNVSKAQSSTKPITESNTSKAHSPTKSIAETVTVNPTEHSNAYVRIISVSLIFLHISIVFAPTLIPLS